ncbi:g3733 [Coccomyxa elongata]
MSLASTLFWAPLTVPYGVYQFSLGLYPVQELLLKPLLSLQASKTDGRLVTLVLTEEDGTVVGRQPLWVGWNYDAAGIICAQSLGPYGCGQLSWQSDKELWVDSLGVCYQRLLSTAYVAVPEAAQAKEFALPLVTLAALVQPKEAPALDAALGATEAATPSPDPPAPRKRSPGKFFVLPARAGGNGSDGSPARPGVLSSHPLNINLSPGSTDIDTPISSPLSHSTTSSRFSPFKP